MCDYSLFEYPNRLAVEGEELATYRFQSRSLGLVSLPELRTREAMCASRAIPRLWSALKGVFTMTPAPVAVCVPHGARLRLEQIPASFRKQYRLEENEDITLVQTTVASHTHRDAIRFANGEETLLQNVPEGQRMRVLALGPDTMETLVDPHVEERQAARSRSSTLLPNLASVTARWALGYKHGGDGIDQTYSAL